MQSPNFADLRDRVEWWDIYAIGPFTVGALAGPTGGAAEAQINISSSEHFYSEFVTISYNTLDAGGLDDGVTHLSVQIRDSAGSLTLTDQQVPLELLAAPGRQRTTAVAGDPSLPLHIQGFPFPYLWEASGNIIMDFRNNIDADQVVNVAWHGWKYPVWSFGELPRTGKI